jgi:CheY-like chemotaxis protein
MSYQELKDKVMLIVEDDPSMAEYLRLNLQDVGSTVLTSKDVKSAEKLIDDSSSLRPIDIAIVDLYIPEFEGQVPDRIMRGEELAYTIRQRSPRTKIVGISNHLERKPFTPLSNLFSGFVYKNDLPHAEPPIILFETIEGILMSPQKRLPKIFIVHGHDSEALLELKNFIQNTLELGQPIILRERASSGRTIIEKFEKETRDVDIVFVLATPDDRTVTDTNLEVRRSRQNVVFELGFFYAKLQRSTGKIIVLKKGEVEIPSDIAGVTYVDITNGIGGDAGENIRRELQDLGWLKS